MSLYDIRQTGVARLLLDVVEEQSQVDHRQYDVPSI